jgi:hypothetical protein
MPLSLAPLAFPEAFGLPSDMPLSIAPHNVSDNAMSLDQR